MTSGRITQSVRDNHEQIQLRPIGVAEAKRGFSVAAGAGGALAPVAVEHVACVSGDPKHKVDWRPALSVADAQRREGINRAVEFQVSVRDADSTGGPIPL